jgi:glycosyltransferase involved in cell wall biosynthesis
MRALEIIGPFRGATGHDRHTREFARHLVKLGVPVRLTPLEGWSPALPPSERDLWFETLRTESEPDVALHFTMPTLCRPRPGKSNVNYTMFEADRLPGEWAARAADHQRIVVPTRSSFDAWVASGIPAESMRIVPLGVDAEFLADAVPPLEVTLENGRPLSSYAHRFLNIADLRPRKNHRGLLRAWKRATRRGDDAVLMLKVSGHPHAVQCFFRQDLPALGSFDGAAPVVFLHQTLSDSTLRSLYRAATHYISMSCGEGWDLPMIESAASGLQLIAPRHSAYLDYLEADDALWIQARRTSAVIEGRTGAEDRRWFDGACWWPPDEDAAAGIIRSVLDERARTRSPRDRIRREYGWESAAARLRDVLEECSTPAR